MCSPTSSQRPTSRPPPLPLINQIIHRYAAQHYHRRGLPQRPTSRPSFQGNRSERKTLPLISAHHASLLTIIYRHFLPSQLEQVLTLFLMQLPSIQVAEFLGSVTVKRTFRSTSNVVNTHTNTQPTNITIDTSWWTPHSHAYTRTRCRHVHMCSLKRGWRVSE
jgi:hypothetical protein